MSCFLLLIIQILTIQSSFACKVSEEYLDMVEMKQNILINKPLESKYILFGKVSGDRSPDSEKIFNTEKLWTKEFPTPIMVGGGFCHVGNYAIGEKYLLLSNDISSPFYVRLIKTAQAKPLIDKLAQKKDFVGDINPAWQFCEKDSECKSVKNKCGRKISLNNFYEKNYLDFLGSKDSARIDCKKETDKKPAIVKNKCVDYFCE